MTGYPYERCLDCSTEVHATELTDGLCPTCSDYDKWLKAGGDRLAEQVTW